jgi:hypothetical protein
MTIFSWFDAYPSFDISFSDLGYSGFFVKMPGKPTKFIYDKTNERLETLLLLSGKQNIPETIYNLVWSAIHGHVG